MTACRLGQGHPKDLANDEHTINNNQMQTKTVLDKVTRQTLPTTADPAKDSMLANDGDTHENKIPTFLCSGDGNLASNEVQASSGK